jgi:hypothetical protein
VPGQVPGVGEGDPTEAGEGSTDPLLEVEAALLRSTCSPGTGGL